jgi:hypothetical protein
MVYFATAFSAVLSLIMRTQLFLLDWLLSIANSNNKFFQNHATANLSPQPLKKTLNALPMGI